MILPGLIRRASTRKSVKNWPPPTLSVTIPSVNVEPFSTPPTRILNMPVEAHNLSWIRVRDGYLWLGYGNWQINTGDCPLVRVDFTTGVAEVVLDSTKAEAMSPPRKIGGWLYSVPLDTTGYYGNATYSTNEGGTWHNVDIPHMLHAFDIATASGTDLIVCGSKLVWDANQNPNDAEACVMRQAERGAPWEILYSWNEPGEGLQPNGTWGRNGDARVYGLYTPGDGWVYFTSGGGQYRTNGLVVEPWEAGLRHLFYGEWSDEVVVVGASLRSVPDMQHVPGPSSTAMALDDSGDVYALDVNGIVYRWSGVSWSMVVRLVGLDWMVYSMAVHGGVIYLGKQDGTVWRATL